MTPPRPGQLQVGWQYAAAYPDPGPPPRRPTPPEAERLSPQAPEIASLRQALQDAQQKAAQRSSRVTALLTEMRDAIARHDFKAANSAFNEAERINVRDPSIEPARVERAKARNAEEKRNARGEQQVG